MIDRGGMVARIQDVIRGLQALVAESEAESGADGISGIVELAGMADREYRSRRRREEEISAALLGEPGWDMLLDLFRQLPGKQWVRTTSLCIGSCAPTTTALRWIKVLEDCGLIERRSDPDDCRVTLVGLSEKGRAAMIAIMTQRHG